MVLPDGRKSFKIGLVV